MTSQARSVSHRRARLLTGMAALAVLGVTTVGATTAGAAPFGGRGDRPAASAGNVHQRDVLSTSHLTVAAANRAAEAALDAAGQENQRVSVAVVDRNGNTVVTLRGDGAGPQSHESAVRKAYTAVSWNAPTSELVRRLEQNPTLADIPNTLFLGGGVPVTFQNAPIAGIGVAGAPSGDLDEKFARAGAATLHR